MLKHFFQKLTAVICAGLITATISFSAFAVEFEPINSIDENGNKDYVKLYSQAVYMENLTTGDIIVDINADEERVPASLTKIMTAVVLLDYFKDDPGKLTSEKVSGDTMAFDDIYGLGASNADIRQGEELCYLDLLYALMLPSACEAANIIAENISPSLSSFNFEMNAKAKELGMEHTYFNCSHGLLAQNNYTTCRDIATLCKYALENDTFKEVVATATYKLPPTEEHPDGTTISNTNKLVDPDTEYYYEYCKGIKTGFMDEAGRCLASYAEKDGQTYLIVSMGAPAQDETGKSVMYNCIDHKTLYEWAFSHLQVKDFVNPVSEVCDAKILYGKSDSVNLRPAEGYSRLWADYLKDSDIKKTVTVSDKIIAPVKEGDVLGNMTLEYNGEVITTIDLVATGSVERNQTAARITVAKSFFVSDWLHLLILILVVVFLIYIFCFVAMIKIHKQAKMKIKKNNNNNNT